MFIFLARLGGLIISCSKFHSAIFVTLLSCIYINLAQFSITCEFSYSSARLCHSIFLWSHQESYFLPDTGHSHCSHFLEFLVPHDWRNLRFGFNNVELIHHVVNNSMVILFFSKTIFRYGIDPTVLSKLGCSVLSSKFPPKTTSIRRMSKAMDHTVFWCSLQAIYISLTALDRALILCGVSVWWGRFFSLIPTESITVGYFPSNFFIIRCYHTFINTFRKFHTLKHINSL